VTVIGQVVGFARRSSLENLEVSTRTGSVSVSAVGTVAGMYEPSFVTSSISTP